MGRKKSATPTLDELPARKRKYVKNRADGQSKFDAALDAGFPMSMARNAAAKIETPDVQEAFRELIRKAIPADRIVQRISEGIDAMETEFAKHEGRITDEREVIAWGERREYLKLAAQFGGYVADKKEDPKYPSSDTKVIVIGQVVAGNA